MRPDATPDSWWFLYYANRAEMRPGLSFRTGFGLSRLDNEPHWVFVYRARAAFWRYLGAA